MFVITVNIKSDALGPGELASVVSQAIMERILDEAKERKGTVPLVEVEWQSS